MGRVNCRFHSGRLPGLLGTSFLGATPKSHDGWEGWAVSLYYVAAAVGILLLNAPGTLRKNPGPAEPVGLVANLKEP